MMFLAAGRLVGLALLAAPATAAAPPPSSTGAPPFAVEPMQPGPFAPTWESLARYQVPAWYARKMYEEGSDDYRHHVQRYGHPSRAGFKDVIHEWKAEKWDPARLLALYKRAGAQYFFALANHHDNFDLWDSKHQPWNAVRMGPKKDLM